MRALTCVVLMLVLTVLPLGAASAGGINGLNGVKATSEGRKITVEISAGAGGTVRVGSNPLADCIIVAGLTGSAAIDYAGGTGIGLGITNPEMENSDSAFVFISCPNPIFDGFRWEVWEQTEPVPGVVIDSVAEAARAALELPLPVPQTAPDGLTVPFLTQLPVWLWVSDDSWTPTSATASLPEIGLSVTVTATPSGTVWDTGQGDAVVCDAGVTWTPNLPDDASNCQVTFVESTPPGTTIPLSVTTSFSVSFACTPGLCDPAAIGLGGIDLTASRPVTVTEARGVLTS